MVENTVNQKQDELMSAFKKEWEYEWVLPSSVFTIISNLFPFSYGMEYKILFLRISSGFFLLSSFIALVWWIVRAKKTSSAVFSKSDNLLAEMNTVVPLVISEMTKERQMKKVLAQEKPPTESLHKKQSWWEELRNDPFGSFCFTPSQAF
jgi:hypothetical protein